MRITFISTSTIPSRTANSISVMRMSAAFSALGHDVRLIAAQDPDLVERGVSDDHDYYGVPNTFEIKKLIRGTQKSRHNDYAEQALDSVRSRTNLVYTRSLAAAGSAPP